MLKKIGYIITGSLAGFINGLLGTGGGIIIVYAMGFLEPKLSPKDVFATSVTAILPMSVVSAGMYLSKGSFDISQVYIYILPALLGGAVGAFLTDRIKTSLLKKIFAVLVIYAGVNMLL